MWTTQRSIGQNNRRYAQTAFSGTLIIVLNSTHGVIPTRISRKHLEMSLLSCYIP
jgi:hypothetical protein